MANTIFRKITSKCNGGLEMERVQLLQQRFEAMGKQLSQTEGALLLLGLGSAGSELARMDKYSDLDFFVVVEEGGYKQKMIANLDWLDQVHPLAFSFQNTADGHKVMYTDGIYGEFAIFEHKELSSITYSGGRIVWKRDSFDASGIPMQNGPTQNGRTDDLDYCINEALANIYVGLCRYARGEKLNACTFIESSAVGNLLKVAHLFEPDQNLYIDRFGLDRRVEKRHPKLAKILPSFVQGYERIPHSAGALLDYLESIYPVNQKMAAEIRIIIRECE